MKETIEKLEHGLMVCEATGTTLVYIEGSDAKKIVELLKQINESREKSSNVNRFANPKAYN